MSDFTDRAATEAEQQIRRAMRVIYEGQPIDHGEPPVEEMGILGFVSGAEWARRELLAELTGSEAIEVSDELDAEFPQLGLSIADRVLIAHCVMDVVAERRGSE